MTYSTYDILRAEQQLLLCSISPVRTAENVDRIRSCAAKFLDWDYLFVFARRHARSIGKQRERFRTVSRDRHFEGFKTDGADVP